VSSFIAHALVGASCFVIARPKTFHKELGWVLVAACLGLSPDVDYLLLWGAGWQPNPRVTHSLVFSVAAATSAWALCRLMCGPVITAGLLLIFMAAACSHLLLDFMVGVTSNPLAWPFIDEGFSASIGLLPSAGKPDVFNVYFWRNLFIELGIVVPALTFAYVLARKRQTAWLSWKALIGLGIFIVSVYISVGLSR